MSKRSELLQKRKEEREAIARKKKLRGKIIKCRNKWLKYVNKARAQNVDKIIIRTKVKDTTELEMTALFDKIETEEYFESIRLPPSHPYDHDLDYVEEKRYKHTCLLPPVTNTTVNPQT